MSAYILVNKCPAETTNSSLATQDYHVCTDNSPHSRNDSRRTLSYQQHNLEPAATICSMLFILYSNKAVTTINILLRPFRDRELTGLERRFLQLEIT